MPIPAELPDPFGLDFRLLFDATPIPYLVLTPAFTIVAANEARLRATMTVREDILGRALFEVFPDNPADPGATGVRNLRASLHRVLQNRVADEMPIQKYDIPKHSSVDDEFEVRYWKPLNSPVFGPSGDILYILHCVEDVTEQVLKQQAVEKSEAHFRQIADAMPQMVWSALADGSHDYYNRQYYEFAGVEVGETLGQKWGRILHPEDLARAEKVWAHCLASGDPYEIEYRLRHHSGQYHWVLARALPIRNQAGDIERWMGTCTDMHEMKIMQAKLQDAQSRLEATLSAAELGTWTWDIEADRVFADRNFAQMFHVSEQDAHGGPLQAYIKAIHPDDLAGVKARVQNSVDTGHSYHHHYRLCQPDGSVRYIHARGRIEFDAAGKPSRMPGVALDITSQKLAEEAQLRTESQFRTLAENIPQLAWMADSDGWIFWYNNRWFDYTGCTLEEMQGWGWEKVQHPDFLEAVKAKYYDSIVKKQIEWEDLFPLRSATGEYRWFLSRAVPIRDQGGRTIRWFGTNTDITAQREAEVALDQANRRKDEFLAMLAHELRNPLAPISAASELLGMASSDESMVKNFSEVISRQVKLLTSLVDDLLDVSRVTRGLASIEKAEVKVGDAIESAIEQSRPLIEARNHVLSLPLAPSKAVVLGDRTRLIQVVTNLLINAAKYTPAGGQIELSTQVKGRQVCISVRDNGIGMDARLLPHVFDLFTQAERTPDRSQGGLGLGLALVKSIVMLHGGTVTARSEGLGKGSRFTLTLPTINTESETFPSSARQGPGCNMPRPMNILIVDDNADAAVSLEALLQAQGHLVTIRQDAKSAIEEAKILRPEALILDIGLPDMDGYELSRRLHGIPETQDAVYIALTGYGQEHDRVLAKAAGFRHYFVKPIDMATLRRALSTSPLHS